MRTITVTAGVCVCPGLCIPKPTLPALFLNCEIEYQIALIGPLRGVTACPYYMCVCVCVWSNKQCVWLLASVSAHTGKVFGTHCVVDVPRLCVQYCIACLYETRALPCLLSALSSQLCNVHKMRCPYRISDQSGSWQVRTAQPKPSLCPDLHYFRPVPWHLFPLKARRLPQVIPAELHPGPVFLRHLSRAPVSAGQKTRGDAPLQGPQLLLFLICASASLRLSFREPWERSTR